MTPEQFVEKVIEEEYEEIDIEICIHLLGYSSWSSWSAGRMRHTIYVPDKKGLGYFEKKTLRHEVGHIIFNELMMKHPGELELNMKMIKKHKRWCRWQRWWYWTPWLRAIRIKLGFSIKLEYGPDDYYKSEYTRADNEMFCDWFAVRGMP